MDLSFKRRWNILKTSNILEYNISEQVINSIKKKKKWHVILNKKLDNLFITSYKSSKRKFLIFTYTTLWIYALLFGSNSNCLLIMIILILI